MNNTALRTQIILPRDLRQAIEKVRARTGESLSEYLRQAAAEQLKREARKKLALQRLATEVVGSVKRSAWAGPNVSAWQRQLRRDRF